MGVTPLASSDWLISPAISRRKIYRALLPLDSASGVISPARPATSLAWRSGKFFALDLGQRILIVELGQLGVAERLPLLLVGDLELIQLALHGAAVSSPRTFSRRL